ncbi:MAG: T9SS type A sorting domain-containing protein [Bacteroidota bacterium]
MVQNWIGTNGTPDYFNLCDITNTMGVPNNRAGYQQAATGNAYAGLLVYTNGASCSGFEYREYISCSLNMPLQVGIRYYVSLKVSPTKSNYAPFKYCTDKIGALFTTYLSPQMHINNLAQIYSNIIVCDTSNWTSISGSFISDSSYSYLSIGNFFSGINTTASSYLGGTAECAYYYFDDICVSTDSATCAAYHIGIPEYSITNRDFKLYPNPNGGIMTLEYKLAEEEIGNLSIFDVTAKLISRYNFTSNNTSLQIDESSLNAGAYFYEIKVNGNKVKMGKLIIVK